MYNLINQKFGRLTALKPTNERKNGSVVWECVCECGKTCKVSSKHLRAGQTQSCGCKVKDHAKSLKTLDLTGQMFGHLTALCPTKKRVGKSIVWKCKCDCGATTYKSAHKFKKGAVRSCGHLRGKHTSKPLRCIKTNEIYPSQTASASVYNTTPQNISYAINHNVTAKNLHWERLAPSENIFKNG